MFIISLFIQSPFCSSSHPPPRKRVTTISSGSDVPITQPLLQQQQQRVTSTGTLTDDVRPQSILKQQPQPPSDNCYQPDRRSLYASNKSLNDYNPNGGSVTNVTNCTQHTTPKCTPVRHHQDTFTDISNLRHASMITHSNSDLNQICPHNNSKGSSKSKLWRKLIKTWRTLVSPTSAVQRFRHHSSERLINKLSTRLPRSQISAMAVLASNSVE